MMNSTLNNQCKVRPGTLITGKWNFQQYVVVKQLGIGATGTVYLVRDQAAVRVALKMSVNSTAITAEANVLKSFEKVQGKSLGPSFIDVDDWVHREGKVSFYVMEYVHGMDLLTFVHQKGDAWTIVFMLQLLNDLEELHNSGWVFGDLKPENLIVSERPARIRTIDVGGTTMKGRAIKEYTAFFDRGYWGLGTRRADPSYDLFAVAMIMINVAYPTRFLKEEGGIERLRRAVRDTQTLRPYEPVILKALQGGFQSAKEMRQTLLLYVHKDTESGKSQVATRSKRNGSSRSRNKRTTRDQSKKRNVIETSLILFVVSLFYIIYLYNQVM